MSNKYEVWSTHQDIEEPYEVLEVTRTDKAVAYDDKQLIQSILHRKARVQEVDDARRCLRTLQHG